MLKKAVVNLDGEEIISDLSQEELEQFQKDRAKILPLIEQNEKELAELNAARKVLLEKLGITEEEAKLLLS